MKTLIDQNVLTEKFVIGWFDKSFRLDKESALYDKKAEKKIQRFNRNICKLAKKCRL